VVSNTYCVEFLPSLSSFFVPYVASSSEMSVFIAPLLVFANVYLYNSICRLSTSQESNRWSAVFHEYKDNNVNVRSIRLYYGSMATINLNISEYYLAFWNVQNMWEKNILKYKYTYLSDWQKISYWNVQCC
jgi:hypothetical protein